MITMTEKTSLSIDSSGSSSNGSPIEVDLPDGTVVPMWHKTYDVGEDAPKKGYVYDGNVYHDDEQACFYHDEWWSVLVSHECRKKKPAKTEKWASSDIDEVMDIVPEGVADCRLPVHEESLIILHLETPLEIGEVDELAAEAVDSLRPFLRIHNAEIRGPLEWGERSIVVEIEMGAE